MIIACHSIQKAFNDTVILKDINFHIEEREKIALIGNNGAGKTTLFRILTGDLTPDNGEVFIAKNTRVGYLSQNFHFDSNSTVYDELLHVFDEVIAIEEKLNIMAEEISRTHSDSLTHTYDALRDVFEQKRGYEYKSLVKGVLKGLGFDSDIYTKPISILSGGQKTRVALAKLLLEEPNLLLLDEPTNHLDIAATEWLENYLRSYKGAVITISHDRYFLDKVATKIIHLEFGKSTIYHGNYSYYLIESAKVYEQAMHTFEKQQQELSRQKNIIAKLRQFNREKSIKRARSREKLLAKQEPIEVPMIDNKPMNLILTPRFQSGNDVLSAEHVGKTFDDGVKLFSNFNFEIKKGDKIVIVGPNGIGKTTLFNMILGITPLSEGQITLGTNVSTGYYNQEHATLDSSLTIFDELQNSFPTLTNGHIRNVLAAFLFTGDEVFKLISTLSGGEKGRVALAKLMLSDANFLLLDEPTNHLDMISKEVLENALNQYEGTLLYVSHDRYFINQTATKVFEMHPNGINVYIGDYDYYLEKKKTPESTFATSSNTTASKTDWKKQKEFQNRIKKLKSTISTTLETIEQKESLLVELDMELCLPEVYTNPVKSQEILEMKNTISSEITDLYTKWEDDSTKLSELEA
ncbi:MAG: ABC-F family ATP-binding cassette domain-containing protein [Cellulosilyticaceae bacterium]